MRISKRTKGKDFDQSIVGKVYKRCREGADELSKEVWLCEIQS